MITQTQYELEPTFDRGRCRHYLNGELTVFHCHHYSTLYTQLAMDAAFARGPEILAESAEDSFYKTLRTYYEKRSGLTTQEKLTLACQYYSELGLGKMNVGFAGLDSGEVYLNASHIDQGWIKKWGRCDKPVNYVTCGFIAAAYAAVYGQLPRTYRVQEVESIVRGAERSRFTVVRA